MVDIQNCIQNSFKTCSEYYVFIDNLELMQILGKEDVDVISPRE